MATIVGFGDTLGLIDYMCLETSNGTEECW